MRRELRRLTLKPEDTLRRALEVIDRGGIEIAFVCDKAGRVLGTVTDGDARRAILSGQELTEKGGAGRAMQRRFRSVSPDASRVEVLDLMRAFTVSQVPILDGDGKMVGLHLLREFVGGTERPNWAVVMAGGRGTRLRPLTQRVPKPMLKVAGRPILERIVLHLVGHGIRRIFLSLNYLGTTIPKHFGDGSNFGCEIEYLEEDEPLGTAGPLSLLPSKPKEPVIVLNGDLVTNVDIHALLEFHKRGRYSATTSVRPFRVEIPYGVVSTKKRRLVGIEEKPVEHKLINAGIYVLSPRAIGMVPKKSPFTMVSLMEKLLKKDLAIGAFLLEGEWTDVGQLEDLKKARGEV